jgi:hypothetical protein
MRPANSTEIIMPARYMTRTRPIHVAGCFSKPKKLSFVRLLMPLKYRIRDVIRRIKGVIKPKVKSLYSSSKPQKLQKLRPVMISAALMVRVLFSFLALQVLHCLAQLPFFLKFPVLPLVYPAFRQFPYTSPAGIFMIQLYLSFLR